jgi:hypothetical protein
MKLKNYGTTLFCLEYLQNMGSPKDVRIEEELDEMSSTNANILPFL